MVSTALKIEDSLIIIIDLQERLLKPISNKKLLINSVSSIIEAADILGVRKMYTEQIPEKLGSTISILKTNERNLANYYSKSCFSCIQSKQIYQAVCDESPTNIIICGIETHICIQQTALDLKDLNYKVFVIADAVSSRNNYDHDISIKRMQKSGIEISSTESIIFELCNNSDRKEFREISKLIKKRHEALFN